MKSFTRSIFNLFDSKGRYHVPLFQRQYVWGPEKQWEPLWDDLRKKAEEHLTEQDVAPHFMGPIVLNQRKTFGNQVQAHDVIDGQQRLTTFQLLLAAFRDFALAQGQDELASEVRRLTRNDGLVGSEAERHKVWPTNADQGQFQQVLGAGSLAALEALHPPKYVRKRLQPRPRMVEAYVYFYSAMTGWAAEPETDVALVVSGLFQAMKSSLQVVSIELESADDPQVIFETLNARGEPLLPSDLLRNFVFLRAGDSAQALYEAHWSAFDATTGKEGDAEGFWKRPERQGRLMRPRLDLFIQHFLALKTLQDVNVGKLYQTYRTWIKEVGPYEDVEAELRDLRRYADAFAKFYEPDTSTREGVFASRLQALDTSTAYPLLLFLVADCPIERPVLEGILQDLESFIVRRMVCGQTIKAYNTLFLNLLRGLKELQPVTRSGFQALLLAQSGTSSKWPDDEEFEREWMSRQLYNTVRPASRLAMLLRALDSGTVDPKREKVVIQGDLTIEHVMPQSWEENWPLPTDVGDADAASIARDQALQTIGNLTLVTQALNSAVSNGSYVDRRPELTKHSALQLNSYFQSVEEWDEAAIRQRGKDLFKIARQIWPYAGDPATVVVPQSTPSPATVPT